MTTHYFNQKSKKKSSYIVVHGTIKKQGLRLYSARGLFSAQEFDPGTKILLEHIDFPQKALAMRFLDLGCGFGLVSSYIAHQYNNTRTNIYIDACDSSALAVDVTLYNMQHYASANIQYDVRVSDSLGDEYFQDKYYNYIITNPPFSAGKQVVHKFIQDGYEHLLPGGKLWIVVPTKKGAKSYIRRCKEQFGDESIEVIALKAGYRVWTILK